MRMNRVVERCSLCMCALLLGSVCSAARFHRISLCGLCMFYSPFLLFVFLCEPFMMISENLDKGG